jgi:hypothetical protein
LELVQYRQLFEDGSTLPEFILCESPVGPSVWKTHVDENHQFLESMADPRFVRSEDILCMKFGGSEYA